MENYIDYQNIMSSALQDFQKSASKEKEEFQKKLAETSQEKAEIMDATNLAVMPFEAKVSKEGLGILSKGVDKLSGGKVSEFNDYINNKLKRVQTNAKNQLSKIKEKITGENTSEEPSPLSEEAEPTRVSVSPDGTENIPLENLGEGELENPSADVGSRNLAETTFGTTEPNTITTDDPETAERIRQTGRQELEEYQIDDPETTTSNAVESASSNAVSTTAENSGVVVKGGISETAGELAGSEAGTDGVLEGVGASLLDDPFSFFIGLALMIGGVVGGIEGSRSVKNPQPKAVAVPNVSTQFGM